MLLFYMAYETDNWISYPTAHFIFEIYLNDLEMSGKPKYFCYQETKKFPQRTGLYINKIPQKRTLYVDFISPLFSQPCHKLA